MPKKDYPAASFSLILAVFALALLLGAPAARAQDAQPSCRWINASRGDEAAACQRRFGSAAQPWSTGRDCTAADLGSYDNTCCCPTPAPSAAPLNPRLAIIGSVVAFFAIITVAVIIYSKSS